jgi:hypothetical protein
MGLALAWQGKHEEAMACYARALELKPSISEVHMNRGLLLLSQGDYERGLPEYDYRWRCEGKEPPKHDRPRWDGSPLEGRTILLYPEQGRGDFIQFVRFASVVKARGGRVILQCPQSFLPILRTFSGYDQLVSKEAAVPDYDVHASVMDLPMLLGTRVDTIPAEIPYLFADPALTERWKEELKKFEGFKIGIMWKGSSQYRADLYRSIRLAEFAPLAKVEGVRLISLQKGEGVEQLQSVGRELGIIDLGTGADEATGAFMETAAIVMNLDLVISADSALGHLAGALGRPAWIALPSASDWRWLLEREDTPWYPDVRLFRQPRLGDWKSVFERMALQLKARAPRAATAARGRSPISIEIAPGELIDRISILELQRSRTSDRDQLRAIGTQIDSLISARERAIGGGSDEVAALAGELRQANEAIWKAEDDLRQCEKAGDYGIRFVEQVRTVLRQRERRNALKSTINEKLGAAQPADDAG